MKLATYILTAEEESAVRAIHERLKEAFPNAEIDERSTIIGIGEEGRCLFCYFSRSADEVQVKFKTRHWLHLTDLEGIESDLAATVALFQTESMRLDERKPPREKKERARKAAKPPKAKKHSAEEKRAESIAGARASQEELFAPYNEARAAVPEDKLDTPVVLCSPRLWHALHNAHIFTVRDVIALPPERIAGIRNLGRKSFQELCTFLTYVGEGRVVARPNEADEPSPLSEELIERKRKLDYIREVTSDLTVDLTPPFLDFDENDAELCDLYFCLLSHICELLEQRHLPPRDCDILLSRFGIGEEPKTLQEIGDMHSISRERVRQLVKKSERRLSYRATKSEEGLVLEYRGAQITARIAEVSAKRFLSFLLLQECPWPLIKYICKRYLHIKEPPSFTGAVMSERRHKRRQEIDEERALAYNEALTENITFPSRMRCISDEAFARLSSVRKKDSEVKPHCLSFDGAEYLYDSYDEERVLKKLLSRRTFKSIKTQSLYIPTKERGYCPDIQCLTHENRFVIIDVKPLLKMCEYESIKKFQALHAYCEEYGFGYLITDGRGNSFAHIDEENAELSAAVLSVIEREGAITYPEYKRIARDTNASVKNLLTLIKKHHLRLTHPFLLQREE